MGAQCPREAIQAIGERRKLLELRKSNETIVSVDNTQRKAD
jgi:hypothetical protein